MTSKRIPILVAAASATLVHVVVLLVFTGSTEQFLSNLAMVPGSLVAFWAASEARERSQGAGKLFWPVIASSFALWTLAQVFWMVRTHYDFLDALGPNASLIIFFFSFAPFWLLLLLHEEQSPGKIDWQRTCDLLQLGIVLVSAYLMVFYFPTRHESEQETSSRMLDHVFMFRNGLTAVLLWLRAGVTRSKRERSIFSVAALFVTLYGAFS